MITIKGLPKNHDHINHMGLRSDLENGNVEGETLVATGKIHNEPETWALDRYYGDEDSGNSYLYESKYEYEEDIEILTNGYN